MRFPTPTVAGLTLDTLPQAFIGAIEEARLDLLRDSLEAGGQYAGYSASSRFSMAYSGGNMDCHVRLQRARGAEHVTCKAQLTTEGGWRNLLSAPGCAAVHTALRGLKGYRNERWETLALRFDIDP